MARLIVPFLDIYNNENLPKKQKMPKSLQIFAKSGNTV